jgi:hypothetical protein
LSPGGTTPRTPRCEARSASRNYQVRCVWIWGPAEIISPRSLARRTNRGDRATPGASIANYDGKRYSYYCCVHSLRRDGIGTTKRVKADDLEAAITGTLLAETGNVELTEDRLIPGRDHSEEIARVADQIGHLATAIAVGRATGKNVSAEQATLDRAQTELDRLASLKPVAARIEPVKLRKTFRRHWESLNTVGRNGFLRASKVRAVVSLDGLPPYSAASGPPTADEIPRWHLVERDGFAVGIDLGRLGKLRRTAASA